MNELLKRARPLLALLAATGLAAGMVARLLGDPALAVPIWTAVPLPVLAALLLEILVSLRRGDVGLAVVACLSIGCWCGRATSCRSTEPSPPASPCSTSRR